MVNWTPGAMRSPGQKSVARHRNRRALHNEQTLEGLLTLHNEQTLEGLLTLHNEQTLEGLLTLHNVRQSLVYFAKILGRHNFTQVQQHTKTKVK